MAAGRAVKFAAVTGVAALGLMGLPAAAAPGDVDNGERLYEARCMGCHGEEGDGLGPGAERLIPPPRDFTLGQYKIKTTTFDDLAPDDQDLLRMIRDGMPGSAMPGWGDVLSEQEMWDLVAFLKTFAGLEEEEPGTPIDYGTQVASSAESIAEGRRLFLEDERCAECHGAEGRGDGIKKLKDDNGARTWPRNLTKPWTFRASNDPRDVFTRITGGIPSTQMPSFADPASKKKLSIEARWHIANYVASLAKVAEVVKPENIVVKADKVEGEVPEADDPRWAEAPPVSFFLVPQMIAEERFFTPSNDTITVRALYNDAEIAFLLEWDDRSKSLPGDAQAEKVSEPGLAEDAVALQLPVTIPEAMEKPYFVMGDAARPVNLWRWSSGAAGGAESVALIDGRGMDDLAPREDAAASGLRASGAYDKGIWRVLMRRPLATQDLENDLQFVEGRFIPIALAAWDGSNGERDSKHSLTTWYWLLLAPSTGARPIVIALVVAGLIAAAELWWLRSAGAKA
jgi:DMSO reductase family type II enzyme heme b subunit